MTDATKAVLVEWVHANFEGPMHPVFNWSGSLTDVCIDGQIDLAELAELIETANGVNATPLPSVAALDAAQQAIDGGQTIGHFDICNAMAMGGLDIRLSTLENITNLQKARHGTQVTIGVPGDLVSALGLTNQFIGGLLLCDQKQYFDTKRRLESARDAARIPPQATPEGAI